ncbi:MAG: response regulator transcription factor [Candidatus Didemnitutus sp.]|nr:response regulator transcription factor [Candidatus Didemnitutus sp.]
MRAVIIDDEAPARAALRGLLRDRPDITLVGEAETIEEGVRRLGRDDYDLVFLDVQLRGGTGFDLAPFVRPEARIIFITASDQYAVRAFEVNALDYLIKPVSPPRLDQALRRVSGVAAPPPQEMRVPVLTPRDCVYLRIGNGTTRFVALADLALVVSNENYSDAHLVDGTRLLVRRTMKAWEEVLPPTHFVRVHRTAIINLARYRGADRQSYETTLLHLEGVSEPVRASFRYLPELRERLTALELTF